MTDHPLSGTLPPVCILAGGLGTRLGDETRTVPKPLIEVAGKPFLFHQLELLARHRAHRIVLCVGYLGELIEEAVGDGAAFGLNVAYSYDGPSVIGTGAALRKALPLVGDEFLVLYGDTYLQIDYRELAGAFRRCGQPALMAVLRNDGRWERSNAAFDGEMVRYEKGSSDPALQWVDFGVSVLSARVFELVPEAEKDLAQIFSWLSTRGLLAGFVASNRFYEIGTPESLRETAAFLESIADHSGHGRA